MLELKQLRYFVAIVDAGSLTRAASTLFVAQPALSQQLAALESSIGMRLLNRSTKGVSPTEPGLALYKHAQLLLRLAGQTKDVVRGAADSTSGRVRIGLPSTIAVILVAPLLKALREKYPGIMLEVYESPSTYLASELLDERVDLSILVDEEPTTGVLAEPLLHERLYFVHARDACPLPMSETTSLQAVSNVAVVLPARSTTLRQLVDAAFRAAHIQPQVRAETSSVQTLLTLVAEGGGATFVPHSTLSWHRASDLLWACVVEPPIVRKAWIAHSRLSELTQASVCVRTTILEVVKNMVHDGSWQGATLQY